MDRGKVISFSVAAVLGAAIWAISPAVLGVVEPWDAESPYYYVSLFVAGVLVGLVVPRHVWVVLIGVVAGQLVYMLAVLPKGPMLPLGVVFLFGYGVLALVGAFLSAKLRCVVQSMFVRNDNSA